jgi:hypothetical protein
LVIDAEIKTFLHYRAGIAYPLSLSIEISGYRLVIWWEKDLYPDFLA